jgi:hypothetical protein
MQHLRVQIGLERIGTEALLHEQAAGGGDLVCFCGAIGRDFFRLCYGVYMSLAALAYDQPVS